MMGMYIGCMVLLLAATIFRLYMLNEQRTGNITAEMGQLSRIVSFFIVAIGAGYSYLAISTLPGSQEVVGAIMGLQTAVLGIFAMMNGAETDEVEQAFYADAMREDEEDPDCVVDPIQALANPFSIGFNVWDND
jgi:hypothetical protein